MRGVPIGQDFIRRLVLAVDRNLAQYRQRPDIFAADTSNHFLIHHAAFLYRSPSANFPLIFVLIDHQDRCVGCRSGDLPDDFAPLFDHHVQYEFLQNQRLHMLYAAKMRRFCQVMSMAVALVFMCRPGMAELRRCRRLSTPGPYCGAKMS